MVYNLVRRDTEYVFEVLCNYGVRIVRSFIYLPTDAQVSCLKKTILKCTLKFTTKQLRHVSVQLHHHQGAHYLYLLLSNVTTNIHQQGPTNIRSHITTVLSTHRCKLDFCLTVHHQLGKVI